MRVHLLGSSTVQIDLLAFVAVPRGFAGINHSAIGFADFRHNARRIPSLKSIPANSPTLCTIPANPPRVVAKASKSTCTETISSKPCRAVAKVWFCIPRSLRKWPLCLEFEACFPVWAVWHPAFAQVGGLSMRPRVFRAGKIKHEGRFRSERGYKLQLSREEAGKAGSSAFFHNPAPAPGLQVATHDVGERGKRRATCW